MSADAYFLKAMSVGCMGTIQTQVDGGANKSLLTMSIQSLKKFLEVAPPDYDTKRIQIAKNLLERFKDLQ